MDKTAGILFAISSLPSKYGIGCFSKEAYKFVDWLVEAGQTFWQILPLGPTGYGDSPFHICRESVLHRSGNINERRFIDKRRM